MDEPTRAGLLPPDSQVEFAKADVQRVVPLIVAIGQGTYAFAPAAFGALRALSPAEATLVFVAAAIVQALAIAAFLAGRRRDRVASSTSPDTGSRPTDPSPSRSSS